MSVVAPTPVALPDPAADRPRVLTSLEEIRPAWQALADRAGDPFTTYEWASTWWQHFGNGCAHVVVVGDGSAERIILPLYLGRYGPMAALRFIGGRTGDQLGPVCAPKDRPEAAALLRRLSRERGAPWQVLLAERLPGEWDWATELGGAVVRRDASPLIDLDGGWDAVAQRFGRKLRKEIRRKERVVAREHAVRIRRTVDPAELDRDFDTFLALHRARWGDRSSLLPRADFHRAFAAQALERGWLQLWILELDGRPAAARYDFVLGDQWWAYSAGRDPAWSRASVGLVLRAHTIRTAIELGATRYRLLRGGEAYKDRLATSDPGLITLVAGRGPTGHLAAAGGRVWRTARDIRHRVVAGTR